MGLELDIGPMSYAYVWLKCFSQVLLLYTNRKLHVYVGSPTAPLGLTVTLKGPSVESLYFNSLCLVKELNKTMAAGAVGMGSSLGCFISCCWAWKYMLHVCFLSLVQGLVSSRGLYLWSKQCLIHGNRWDTRQRRVEKELHRCPLLYLCNSIQTHFLIRWLMMWNG